MKERISQHFTASAVVIAWQHILLVHHQRIGAWLPPGGHIEPFEMPHEAAIRETFEETGLTVELSTQMALSDSSPDACLLPLPLSFHRVKAKENGQEVYHLDFVYLCRPLPGMLPRDGAAMDNLPPIAAGPGILQARWVKLTDIGKLSLAANVPELIALAKSKLTEISSPQGVLEHISG